MDSLHRYYQAKKQMEELFTSFINGNSLDECIRYYYLVEDISQEDALVFALCMIKKYFNDLDHDIYHHLGCMVFHAGTPAMLENLLRFQMYCVSDDAIKKYLQSLIKDITSGLQYTAPGNVIYNEKYLQKLKEQIAQNLYR